jgi:hypothetical protein
VIKHLVVLLTAVALAVPLAVSAAPVPLAPVFPADSWEDDPGGSFWCNEWNHNYWVWHAYLGEWRTCQFTGYHRNVYPYYGPTSVPEFTGDWGWGWHWT